MIITTTASYAFQKVFLNIVGPLETDSFGYKYILTLQCDLTKFVEAYPIAIKDSTTKTLVEHFILRYGIPEEICTDRHTEFISNTVHEICVLLNIKQLLSTAYHHESIGGLENSHKALGAYLRIQTDNQPACWSSWVQYWCFCYNTTVHTSTQYTPFELAFGRLCNIPQQVKTNVTPLYNCESYPLELQYQLQRANVGTKVLIL